MTTKNTRTKTVTGWKAFYYDLTARPDKGVVFKYRIGRRFTMKETPVLCERGFHFVQEFRDVYDYYGVEFDIRVCEIKAGGDVVASPRKSAANRITIVRELEPRGSVEMMSKIHHDPSCHRLDRDVFAETLRANLRRYREAHDYAYWILRNLKVSEATEETRKWLDERAGKWMKALEEFGL